MSFKKGMSMKVYEIFNEFFVKYPNTAVTLIPQKNEIGKPQPYIFVANEHQLRLVFAHMSDTNSYRYRCIDFKNLNIEFEDLIKDIADRWYGKDGENGSNLEGRNHLMKLLNLGIKEQFKFLLRYCVFFNWEYEKPNFSHYLVNREYNRSKHIPKEINEEKMRLKVYKRFEELSEKLKDDKFFSSNIRKIKEIQILCEKLIANK